MTGTRKEHDDPDCNIGVREKDPFDDAVAQRPVLAHVSFGFGITPRWWKGGRSRCVSLCRVSGMEETISSAAWRKAMQGTLAREEC